MKLSGAAAMMMMGMETAAWAGAPASWTVTACLDHGSDAALMYRAEATASKLLTQVGVRLVWKSDAAACANGAGLLVTVSRQTAATEHPGALAYALPFDKTRIFLFYDRVQNTASAAVTPFLMGHVLAHEVVHMLQGVDQHAATGVMKARWGAGDYSEMPAMRLRFTEEDARLVREGMRWRNSVTRE